MCNLPYDGISRLLKNVDLNKLTWTFGTDDSGALKYVNHCYLGSTVQLCVGKNN